MGFSERLDSVLLSKGMSNVALAEQLNIRRQTISDWKRTGNLPNSDLVLKISEILNVSIEWLLTGKNPEGLSSEEKNWLEIYRSMDNQQKKLAYAILSAMTQVLQDEITPDNIPLIVEETN